MRPPRADQFPPLKTISNTNLPRPVSSFVGREAELAELVARVQNGAQLVTLIGPGGSGKTWLAIETAAELVEDFPNGVFWVGLATLRDSALVLETVSQTLGAKDGLAAHIGERKMLLLLDNLEQVIEPACAIRVALLLPEPEPARHEPRAPARAGEVEYPVPALAGVDAVSLFCQRAHLEPSEEIAELSARLDNLPLAVELAAARTKYRFHDLRHMCVSRLVAAGADVKLVQAVAGHANPVITLKRYSHLLDARVTEASERFDPARVKEPEART